MTWLRTNPTSSHNDVNDQKVEPESKKGALRGKDESFLRKVSRAVLIFLIWPGVWQWDDARRDILMRLE